MAGKQGIFGFRGWGLQKKKKKPKRTKRSEEPVVISHTEDGIGIEDISEDEDQEPDPPPIIIVESEE